MILHVIAFAYVMVGAYIANGIMDEAVAESGFCSRCHSELFWREFAGHFGAAMLITLGWFPMWVADLSGSGRNG